MISARQQRTCKHWYCELTHPSLPCSFLQQQASGEELFFESATPEAPIKKDRVGEEQRQKAETQLSRPTGHRRRRRPQKGCRQPTSCEDVDVPHAKSSDLLSVSKLRIGRVSSDTRPSIQDFSRIRTLEKPRTGRRGHFAGVLAELEQMLKTEHTVTSRSSLAQDESSLLQPTGLHRTPNIQPRSLIDGSKFIDEEKAVAQASAERDDSPVAWSNSIDRSDGEACW